MMTLGNMRANGVHTLAVWCDGFAHHHRVHDVSGYADDVPVRAFGPRMVCTTCGVIGADARPNWNEVYKEGSKDREQEAAEGVSS